MNQQIILIALLAAAVLLLVFHRKKQIRKPDGIWNILFNGFLLVIYPMVTFIMVEYAIGLNEGALYMQRYYIIRNYGLYFIFEMLFYAITLHASAGIIAVASWGTFLAGVNVYLLRFRSAPLYATDLLDIRTAANVSGGYNYTPTRPLVSMFLFLGITIALGFVSVANVPHKKRWKAWLLRLVFTVCAVGLAYVGMGKAQNIKVRMFNTSKTYRTKGALLSFAASTKYLEVDKPEGYSRSEVKEIAEEYPSDSSGQDQSQAGSQSQADEAAGKAVSTLKDSGGFATPNVIVIMDEAFSDLQSVGSFETNEDPIPFWHSLKENTIRGTAYVSVHGGHTANTEYEFLTGDSYSFIPAGTTPYQVYIKKYMPTMTSVLEQEGYQGNISMHPYKRSGYNRQNVYPHFNFRKCLWQEDFENPQLVRNFISDQADFERIVQEYQTAKAQSDAPFWMFNVTMQNHSSYDMDFDNLPRTIQITSDVADKDQAERYLNLTRLTDDALKTLLAYFESVDDPTVIVVFGDHEPGLSDDFYSSICGKQVSEMTAEEQMDLYKVPFIIWANYDIPEEDNVVTSINYLQAMMNEKLGLRQTGYSKFLNDMAKSVPVLNGIGYYGDDGKFYDDDDKESPYYEKILQYHYLTYNHLFDTNNRSQLFDLED